jgi:hypothetical protein
LPETTLSQPTLPYALYSYQHHAWYFTMCWTAMGWPARIKAFTSMYKCTHRINEKEGIAISQNGDLTVDVSTQPSTSVKTSAIEEKFQ